MPITFAYDQRDAAPEAIREQLVEKDGKYIFEAEPVSVVAETNSKLKKLRSDLDNKTAELGKFGKFKTLTEALADVDEEEIPHVVELWQKRAEKPKGDEQKAEMERRIRERETKKLTDELGLTKSELQKAQAELKDFKLWTPLRDVFTKAGGDPQDWEVARLELSHQQRFGFDEEGRIVVMEDGQPSTVSAEKFFREVYSDQRPKFYKASSAAGSGAQNNTSGSGRGVTLTADQAKDPQAYRAAKEQAAKANTELQLIG